MVSTPLSRSRAASTSVDRAHGLLPGRHQRGAVDQRPAVVLDVRDLEPLRAELDREIDDLAEMVEVLAMHHGIDRERQPGRPDHRRQRHLLGVALAVAADPVGAVGATVLDAEICR